MESNNRVRCQIMRVRLALNDLNDGDIDEEPNSPSTSSTHANLDLESECHLFEVVIVDNEPIPEPLSVKSDDLPEEI
jgi:hypothetical protein